MAILRNTDKLQCQSHENERDYPLAPRMSDCKMITTESLDLRGDDIKRNLELAEELEVEEVKLFGDNDN